MTDDLPFYPPTTAPNPAAPKPKCRRHEWLPFLKGTLEAGTPSPKVSLDVVWRCQRCGAERDQAAARRGRNNRTRGNRIQRERITGLGGQNLAGNNPNLDGIGQRFRYESKSGASFSERYWRWLKDIPLVAGQSGVLIVTDAPGPGRKARSLVVVDYETWRDEHGEQP